MAQQVEHDVAQRDQIVGRIAAAHTGLIVIELHIERPMKLILYRPMGAHSVCALGCVSGQGSDVEMALAEWRSRLVLP
jgi:hypothetical protein